MERQEECKQSHILKNEGSTNNNLLIGLQQTCQRHQGVRLDYLCVDSAQQHIFKCMFCVTDEDVKQYSLIPIQQIQTADQKTIFANYPLSDRELTKQLKLIVEQPSTGEALKSDIEKYFKDLRANMLSKLENIEAKMVAKAQTISDFSGDIASLYNSMSEKENLKSILIDSERSFDDRCLELKALSIRVMSKDEENQQTIRATMNKIQALQKAIDFDSPNSIKNLILKQIDSINMFLIEDMANFSEQLKEQKHQNDIDQSITDLLKLVRNKFNIKSEDSCLKFEEQLNQIKFSLSSLQVPSVGPIHELFQSLTTSQTQVISKLIEDIARSNTEVEASEMKEPVQSQQIFELISNQSNFCSMEYLEDIKNVIDHLGGVFGLFRTRKLNDRTDDQKDFNRINELLPFTKQVPIIFTKTNFEQSQKMGITQVGSNVQLTCPSNIKAQCVSQVLNKDVGYSIKLTFNHPYGQTEKNGFLIGLIQNSKKDSHLDSSWNNWFCTHINYSKNMIFVRGERLSSESIRRENQELLVRFCISKRQCFFSDSTYMNINQVREEHIDPNVDHRFSFLFWNIAETDWMVQISDFQQIDPESVSKFN